MASIFSRIIAGEIPSYKVAEDERHYAFLDINPLAEGHTLVVPKKEIDYIFDLSDDDFAALQLFAKRVAKAQLRPMHISISCLTCAKPISISKLRKKRRHLNG